MNYLSMVRPYQGSGRFLELISGSTSLAQEIIILIFPIGKSILSVIPIYLFLPYEIILLILSVIPISLSLPLSNSLWP